MLQICQKVEIVSKRFCEEKHWSEGDRGLGGGGGGRKKDIFVQLGYSDSIQKLFMVSKEAKG